MEQSDKNKELMRLSENALEKIFNPDNADKIWLKLFSDETIIVFVDGEPLIQILNEATKTRIKQFIAQTPRVH